MEKLQVCMLGGFSIEFRGCRIDDSDTRSQKPWLLIAYLLYHRGRTVTQEELFRVCWGDEEQKDDPANALRVVLHRARAILDKLGILSGAELIVRSRDGFQWNDRIPVSIDAEDFEQLCEAAIVESEPEKRLAMIERAIKLYRGGFLSRFAGEKWVCDVGEHLRQCYIGAAVEGVELLRAAQRREDAADLCAAVLAVEPHHEQLSRCLMEQLLTLGRGAEAAEIYEELRSVYLTKYGRMPEQETQKLYYRVLQSLNAPEIPVSLNRIDRTEQGAELGPKVCDFAFYRMFYTSAEWLITRCGLSVYNFLFDVEFRPGKTASERTVERVMDELMKLLCAQLHRGDAISRSSDRQIIGMIQVDSYEEACRVCEDQVTRFYQAHPHSAVRLRYGVWRVGGEQEEK